MELAWELNRFDLEFGQATAGDLPGLKAKYPFLFPEKYEDSVWIDKMTDSLQQEIKVEVRKAFEDFDAIEADLGLLFRHLQYYFPGTTIPRVITLTSDVDYNNRVILADSLLFIGLDNYLGPDHPFYEGLPRYVAQELDEQYLISDVAQSFSNKLLGFPRERTFLGQMVHYGKLLYLKDKLIPSSSDEEKIRYTEEQLAWAKANEAQAWRYFIERELLYSTDQSLGPRFLDPAPFSKFRLELDSESPGRMGRYMGWQIVRAFMERNEIGLPAMMAMPAEELFKRSNYKPKK